MYRISVFLAFFSCGLSANISAAQWGAKLDTSLRVDERSSADLRYQYRIRFYPHVYLDKHKRWSLNGFAVTGDGFSSSHNTIDDPQADYFYLRRMYLRYQQGDSKTELGIIPTYKGRVSSTGLSKDGFIAGLRQVYAMSSGQLEFVLGDLNDTRASNALNSFDGINYAEVEYSAQINQRFSFEVSADRVLQSEFARTEIRFAQSPSTTYAVEVIQRLDQSAAKLVISLASELNLFNQTAQLFAYYSHVDKHFGPRAELTEDFLATGHGIALELESRLSNHIPLKWFSKFEAYEGSTRIQFGIKYSLASAS